MEFSIVFEANLPMNLQDLAKFTADCKEAVSKLNVDVKSSYLEKDTDYTHQIVFEVKEKK